jgi:hypothetical protein
MFIETLLSTHSQQRPLSTARTCERRGNGDDTRWRCVAAKSHAILFQWKLILRQSVAVTCSRLMKYAEKRKSELLCRRQTVPPSRQPWTPIRGRSCCIAQRALPKRIIRSAGA